MPSPIEFVSETRRPECAEKDGFGPGSVQRMKDKGEQRVGVGFIEGF